MHVRYSPLIYLITHFIYVFIFIDNGKDIILISEYFTLNWKTIPILHTSKSAHSSKLVLMSTWYVSCCSNPPLYKYAGGLKERLKNDIE